MSSTLRRVPLLALIICGALALPGAASAADLTNSGGVLTYTGTDADGQVSFATTGTPGQLRVTSSDDDTITSSNCTAVSGGYDCDGVASIVANGNGGNDAIYPAASVTQPVTADGGAGDDDVEGGAGNDTLRGGAGDDGIYGAGGADDISGGSGIDTTYEYDGSNPPKDVSVTLDDQANDGATGEGDNVHSDVEDIGGSSAYFGTPTQYGAVRLTGNAASNALYVYDGRGAIDGGPGNDVLSGGPQDDTINSVDGYADRVTCGAGNDTVTADTLDQVGDSCENVTRTDVGNAAQDKQPTVAWTAPANNAVLSTSKANTLAVNASDDKGIAKVQFLVGTRIVCEDATAPYSCDYKPQGSEGGRNTLIAIAIDTSQQTATALKPAVVDRFTPKVSVGLTPRTDRTAPYRFRAKGKVTLPTGMSKSTGCSTGTVSVSTKAGSKTISTRRVNIKKDCTFSSTVSFSSRSRFGKAKSLKFVARFSGNAALKVASSKSTTGRVR